MMNDRQRVEALFFPLLFKSILESGAKRDGDYEACRQALDSAMIEVLARLDDKRKASIMRRLYRTVDGVAQPDRKGGVTVEKTALTGYYLIQTVLESGYLELTDGSLLATAILAIVDAFRESFDEKPLDASARKQAGKMLRDLQERGLFQGVEIVREAA